MFLSLCGFRVAAVRRVEKCARGNRERSVPEILWNCGLRLGILIARRSSGKRSSGRPLDRLLLRGGSVEAAAPAVPDSLQPFCNPSVTPIQPFGTLVRAPLGVFCRGVRDFAGGPLRHI